MPPYLRQNCRVSDAVDGGADSNRAKTAKKLNMLLPAPETANQSVCLKLIPASLIVISVYTDFVKSHFFFAKILRNDKTRFRFKYFNKVWTSSFLTELLGVFWTGILGWGL